MNYAACKIDEIREELCALSRDLWEHPEIAFSEYYACGRLKEYLSQNGFSVESPLPELPTAFAASGVRAIPGSPFWPSMTRCPVSARRPRPRKSLLCPAERDMPADIT